MKKFLRFWGTRGSCSVSGKEYLHFGGNTCCLEVQYDSTHVIIDAGTGIRPLGHALHHVKKFDLFLSHTHWDHLIGFPFFEPLYQKGVEITVWAPQGKGRSCRALFDDLLSPEFFPIHLDQVQAQLQFRAIEKGRSVQIGPLTFDFHETHHPGLTYCFKIKTPHETISYVTDNELQPHFDPSFIAFHRGVDLFIHEAQYFPEEYREKTGWGHSSLARTLALVEHIRPSRWFVTHHDPQHTDAKLKELEALAKSLLKEKQIDCPVEWLSDGSVLNLK